MDNYNLLNSLKNYNKINLDDLNSVGLLNRQDTKFIFHQDQLVSILKEAESFYNILDINNKQVFEYDTTYYDTEELIFFNQHKNGKKKRFKIRIRKYSSTKDIFFEIKIKNNKNKTIKERFIFDGDIRNLSKEVRGFTFDTIGFSLDRLKPILKVNFFRITLASKNLEERMTIDMGLKVKNETVSENFNKLVIAEIKQSRYNPKSNFIKILRKFKIHQSKFSKYCIGLIHTKNNLKYNRFKPELFKINKILDQN